ncbi:fibronectin type III domain protein, partial [Teladorsagia circumcincta]
YGCEIKTHMAPDFESPQLVRRLDWFHDDALVASYQQIQNPINASSIRNVRPVAPSSPEVKAFSNRSVTLVWNHNTAKAHRPILRFSVVVRTVEDDSRFVIPAPSNATTVIVDNLSPHTLYAFAVRAENAAGHSPFGPETRFRTLGEAPTSPPLVLAIRNTTVGCVSIAVEPPSDMQGELVGYHLLLQRLDDNEPRREL